MMVHNSPSQDFCDIYDGDDEIVAVKELNHPFGYLVPRDEVFGLCCLDRFWVCNVVNHVHFPSDVLRNIFAFLHRPSEGLCDTESCCSSSSSGLRSSASDSPRTPVPRETPSADLNYYPSDLSDGFCDYDLDGTSS